MKDKSETIESSFPCGMTSTTVTDLLARTSFQSPKTVSNRIPASTHKQLLNSQLTAKKPNK